MRNLPRALGTDLALRADRRSHYDRAAGRRVLASAAFSFYVANFGRYDATYGSLGAVIVLLFWFYLSFFIVLLGAEINAEREFRTGQPTRSDALKPRQMADSAGVPSSHGEA